MKIAVLTNYYPPYARGGAEAVALETVNGLRALGHDVCVLTSIPFGGLRTLWPQCATENGVRVYRWFPLNIYYLANASRWAFPFRLLWTAWDALNPAAYYAARRVLRHERPDAIISHNIKGMGCGLPRLVRRITPNYIHVLHDVQLVEPSGLLFPGTVDQVANRLSNRLFALMMRWSFAMVPVVVAPSKFLLDFYTKRHFFHHAQTKVVLNALSVPQRKMLEKKEATVIGYVGQLEVHKGIFILLEAWKHLAVTKARLFIVGDGSQAEKIRHLAHGDSRIEIQSYPKNAEREGIWDRINVLVMPSICLENSPIVIMEALARGIPVVASNVGGIPELIHMSSASALVPAGDSTALANTLEDYVLHPRAAEPIPFSDAEAYTAALLKLLN